MSLSVALIALLAAPTGVRAADEDSPKAAATRKLLKKKIDVDFDDIRLEEVVDEIKEKVPGLKFILDSKGGVSRNSKLTFKGKGKTVEEVLDGLFKKTDLGYFVISKKNNAYDGLVKINKSAARGFEKASKD
jgi:hypothetical protein